MTCQVVFLSENPWQGSIKHPQAVAIASCSSMNQLAPSIPGWGGCRTDAVLWEGGCDAPL